MILTGFFAAICIVVGNISAWASDIDHLTIYIPGSEGGGFDRTGEAVRQALIAEDIVGDVEIIRSPGAGGLIALAQFIESREGDSSAVFLGGRTNIGATDFNRSRVSLNDTRAIARLNGIIVAIAVPKKSKIKDFGDLVSTLREDPGLIKWVGGSAGSVDELLILEVAALIGVDRSRIDYRSVPGGGDSVVEHLMSGQSNIAVSSFEELADFSEQGDISIIALSSENRISQINAPTLKELSLDIVSSDWKGVFAPPGISDEDARKLETVFKRMSVSASWARAISENGWLNNTMTGEDFSAFVISESELVQKLRGNENIGQVPVDQIEKIVGRPYWWMSWAAGIIGLLLLIVFGQRFLNRRREEDLSASLQTAEGELEKKLSGATDHINAEFTKWRLTESENEIGWLLLKGLSFKEIAKARGTSERTVRQQARAIYAKSNLANRSDLAAYFFEDFVFGTSEAT